MRFHRNAKLGLAGRRELVLAIEGGCSIRAAAAAFQSRRQPRTAGGSAGGRRAMLSERAFPVFSIVPAARRTARAGSRPSSSRQSATAGARPAGGRGSWPAPPASATPRCGRCSAASASRDLRDLRGSPRIATSGPAPAISCTWTSRSTCASSSPAIGSRVIAALPRSPPGRDRLRSCTPSSTTTPASPTQRSARRRAPRLRRRLPRASARLLRQRRGSRATRVMTDNAFAYVHSRAFRELLARRGIRHLTTKPYRPRTNGKVCVSRSGCRPVGRRGCPLPSV